MTQVVLSPELIVRAGRHILDAMQKTPGVDAAALCALNGQVLWASDAAFQRAAENIARIGIMSLKLWVKVRSGKLDRIGLVTDRGTVDLLFVPPIASVLVVSGHDPTNWVEGEPEALLRSLGVPAGSLVTAPLR